MKLKDNLKALRKKANLTQSDLARRLHIKQYNVSDYEIGRIEPSIQTLIKYADIFNVSIDFLVGRKEKESGSKSDFNDDIYIHSIIENIKNLPLKQKKQISDTIDFILATYK